MMQQIAINRLHVWLTSCLQCFGSGADARKAFIDVHFRYFSRGGRVRNLFSRDRQAGGLIYKLSSTDDRVRAFWCKGV